ncbi:MAG: DEAD/DEAH box helicase [Bacillota bacterium]|nr:MAG: DEAD/DEAH box helicase [Bacillota bacterium]
MTTQLQRPDVEAIMQGLKNFQRRSADYVFDRLYTSPNPVDRFLIADEVGLGKTVVARGIIAKAIDHLWDTTERIDIIYICSNVDIARQNVNSLNVLNQKEIAVSSRLTLLPTTLECLNDNKVNFISFTPGTSFNLGFKGGVANERLLLYSLLHEVWEFGDTAGPKALLQGDVVKENWAAKLKGAGSKPPIIDPATKELFLESLSKNPDLRQQFVDIAVRSRYYRERRHIPVDVRRAQNRIIGELRTLLAQSCIGALQPDLVILDEFQRFKDLLDGSDEVAALAKSLFTYPKVKMLLLSATPYKMYTMYHESEDNNHYQDFTRTMDFLYNDPERQDNLAQELEHYRRALLTHQDNPTALISCKEAIERTLRSVMVRTERISLTADNDGMLAEVKDLSCCPHPSDIQAFRLTDEVAMLLKSRDTIEYWKSAPYLLNLMDSQGYKIKRELMEQLDLPSLYPTLLRNESSLLSWDNIKSFSPLDPQNARLRLLLETAVQTGAWQLLWVPASQPYYHVPGSPFEDPILKNYTKSLIFSSWQVVPKSIAMLVSYEAERHKAATPGDYEKHQAPLLRFAVVDGRLTALSAFTLLYPCQTLAQEVDPLQIALSLPGHNRNIDSIRQIAQECVALLIDPLIKEYQHLRGAADERWYSAALLILDRHHHQSTTAAWLNTQDPAIRWETMSGEDTDTAFAKHIAFLKQCFNSTVDLGRPPADLVNVLTTVALAAPAVVTLRALRRRTTDDALSTEHLAAAAKIALGFRSQFNVPDSITLVRKLCVQEEQSYWAAVLDYCIIGNLQAVMDEYMHILADGPQNALAAETIRSMAADADAALSLRTANLEFDELTLDHYSKRVTPHSHRMRCRFALRFGDVRNYEDEKEMRKDTVRRAFNSPFRPFVLASTSIGQEGLDFHRYCHSIYHWNLPANPIDMEQREGRVHRYKGHAIRRNVAKAYPLSSISPSKTLDPWSQLFELAQESSQDLQNDLVPYWLYETKDGHKINRYIPALPLSREVFQMDTMRKHLAAYRLVFGQPRQEDLVAYLSNSSGDTKELLMHRIRLEPPGDD